MMPSKRSWRSSRSRFSRRESETSFVFFNSRLALLPSTRDWSFCTIRGYLLEMLEIPKDLRPLSLSQRQMLKMHLSSNSASASVSKQQQQQASVPGALFEDKTQSANDAWRKLHYDSPT
ncbi:pre-mRNA-splicing factor CWC25-like [Quillaja saponaria]|uniref:Pre-mRNA-splicing factor CWC25-like n=1 Tax=Quillaja saponaria TaxID=32244 RepID=A0AAD7M0U6_QUISA|nr:pre-mRNA-splicing factor CWC25-like [Quillaja saponaria]